MTGKAGNAASSIDELRAIMARLRDPEGGCPWDLKQDFDSIAPYTLEEAYEVADAIDRRDYDDLRDELGDLLLQVVFHARMAEEQGLFDVDDVAAAINAKMVRRHPHVFGDAESMDVEQQARSWDAIKSAELAHKGGTDHSALAGIARGLPEYRRALKLQNAAARTGFDWPDPAPVLAKLAEELDEVRAEFEHGGSAQRIEEEIGDLLFVVVNLTRHADVDFSRALRRANAKFERRFRYMETMAQTEGRSLQDVTLADQEALWARAKQDEKTSSD